MLQKMDGLAGVAGWRWIFIIEGIATVVIALGSFFLIYDDPNTASFLTPEERQWAVTRLRYQGSGSRSDIPEMNTFQWKYVKAACMDWQVMTSMFMNMGLLAPLFGKARNQITHLHTYSHRVAGISLFLPTIIASLGYSSGIAQLMTVSFRSA
jgi:hypothetical protein